MLFGCLFGSVLFCCALWADFVSLLVGLVLVVCLVLLSVAVLCGILWIFDVCLMFGWF